MSSVADYLTDIPQLLERISLDDLRVEHLFDLPAEQLAAARDYGHDNSFVIAADSVRGRMLRVDGAYVVYPESVRNDVARRMGRVAADVQAELDAAVALIVAPAQLTSERAAAPGSIVLYLPAPITCTASVRLGRLKVDATQLAVEDELDEAIRIGAAPVAVPRETLGHYELLVHPFLSNGAVSVSNAERRARVLKEICTAILAARGGHSGQSEVDPALAEAVQTADLVIPVMRALSETMAPRQAELEERVRAAELRAAEAREQMLSALQSKREAQAELEALRGSSGQVGAKLLERALVEVTRIRQNRCVKQVRFTGGSDPKIEVTLVPLVLRHGSGCYLFDRMRFTMPLLTNGTPELAWEDVDPSPHPHVSREGYTCWGDADQPLREAMRRREFSTVVRFVTGWASTYNHHSPYVPINQFPTTDLAPGWYPELEVSL